MATTRRRTRTVQQKPHWFESRSTGDLLILIIASTVCFSVLASGMTIGILALVQPERNVAPAIALVGDVINTLIGLLAGFLAGRTDAHLSMTRSPDGTRTWEADRSASARTVSDAEPRDV